MSRNSSDQRNGQIEFQLAVFQTPLGWFGLLGNDGQLVRIRIGCAGRQAAIDAFEEDTDGAPVELTSWHPDLEYRLRRFANGEKIEFADIEVVWPRPLTEFRQRVIEQTRKIKWGQTMNYGVLAERSGTPRAARAVGSTMATNRFPIVVPCHRVVSASDLGGFTAPTGISLKRQLLAMEAGD